RPRRAGHARARAGRGGRDQGAGGEGLSAAMAARVAAVRVIRYRPRTVGRGATARSRPRPRERLMITVHHLENSRSHRVLWLLEELGVPYEMKRYKREPGGFAPAALKAVHPLGKAPVVVDGDVVVAESGAVIEYLVDSHGGGRLRPPPGTPAHRRYVYWLHYAEGSVMPLLCLKLIVGRMAPGSPALVRPIVRAAARGVRARVVDPRLALHLDYMEAELAQAPWFAGAEFSAADIQMSF